MGFALLFFFSFFHCGFNWKDPFRSGDLSFTLNRTEDRYYFHASVFIESEPACLLETIYRFHHWQQLLKGNTDEFQLLRQEKDRYDVRTVHKGKFYLLDTVYRRSLQKELNRVAFELIETKQEGRIIPKITSSKGYYALEAVKGGVKVHYFEETRLTTAWWDPRTSGFVEIVAQETLSFLKNLKQYAEKTACRGT